MAKKMTVPEQIAHEENYVAFLQKRLNSENFKANSSQEEYDQAQKKYDKAKFILKTLKERLKGA